MRTFELLWRNKYLTAEVTSLDEMIVALQAAADELRQMQAAGVALRDTDGVSDDYACLVTTDPKVAETFGFEEEEEEEFMEEEDGE
jgi:hypothetical protein